MNRRSMLRTIPAAMALAILPSRLTQRVRAQDERADSIVIHGTSIPMPKAGYVADYYFDGGKSVVFERTGDGYTYRFEPLEQIDDLVYATISPTPLLQNTTITGASLGWETYRWPGGYWPGVVLGSPEEIGR